MKTTHTVMIIDNSREDRYFLKRSLTKSGLSLVFVEAKSGKHGLNILRSSNSELISTYPSLTFPVTLILDIHMPVMDGWQFLDAFQEQDREIQQRINRVVMHSGSSDQCDLMKAERHPIVTRYLVKGTIDTTNLVDSVIGTADKAA